MLRHGCVTVLKVVQERSRVSPTSRGRVAPPQILFIYFWFENGEFWCILGGILCDIELQESKQETRYRPGKSKGAGSRTLATRPHFKPWCVKYIVHMSFMARDKHIMTQTSRIKSTNNALQPGICEDNLLDLLGDGGINGEVFLSSRLASTDN